MQNTIIGVGGEGEKIFSCLLLSGPSHSMPACPFLHFVLAVSASIEEREAVNRLELGEREKNRKKVRNRDGRKGNGEKRGEEEK